MKSALSLTLIVCLVGSTVPMTAQFRINPTPGPIAQAAAREAARRAANPNGDSPSGATQAQDRIENRGIRIFVTMEPNGERTENELRGARDSAKNLRTRLEERVDREIVAIVSDPAQANLTIVVTRREIIFGTNTVHARLTVGDFSSQFTGRNDGMWGPAATDLAKNISAWLSANALQIRASIQEGVRLTAARLIDPGRSAWASVRRLAPGTEVTVTVRGSQSGKRHVVSASDSVLTVLNLTDPSLPDAATRALLSMAANRSEYFAGAQTGGNFLFDKSVRIASDGVFVADQKVADLGQVVETIARTDVVEIRSSGRTLSPVQKGALIGAIAGVATGLTGASLLCDGSRCYTSGYVWAATLFGGPGAGIGALMGTGTHKAQDVIYRAP